MAQTDLHRPLLEEPDEELGADTSERSTPRVAVRVQRPYGTRRVTFLVLHYVPFFAQLCLMRIAFQEGNRLLQVCTIAALAFSGLFYSYVAWHTPAQGAFQSQLLPLRERHPLLALALMVPYGLLQWVVVELHLSEDASARTESSHRGQSKVLSYKAVDAIVESLIVSAAVLYSHWTSGMVEGIPRLSFVEECDILRLHCSGLLLVVAQVAIVASGGLGLMHIDHCCSQNMRERMKSPYYMWCHGFFRTCEVVSRLSMLTGFAVMATFHSPWWWLLIVCELGVSAFLVLFHGGLRNTGLATVICIVAATIVNIFCFMDFPARFEYARGISFFLNLKHAVETLIAVVCMVFIMDPSYDFRLHGTSLITAIVATLLFWALRFIICCQWEDDTDPRDNIFTASRNGDLERVLRLTMEADIHLDLNTLDIAGMTPLMYAALGDHVEVCRHLLKQGASPVQKALGDAGCLVQPRRWAWQPAGRQWTALHLAAWRGHKEVLRLLLRGAGIQEHALTLVDTDGRTPLHVAGMFGNNEAFDLIRRLGPQEWPYLLNGRGDLPEARHHELDPFPNLGEEPELADEPAEEPAELVVPVTFTGVLQREVPLGLSSSLVCASSGQVGPAFEPRALVSENVTIPEQHWHAGPAGHLRFTDLTPCREDRTPLPDSPLDPFAWRQREVSIGAGQFGWVGRACDPQGTLYAVKCMSKDSLMYHCAALREAQVGQAVRERPHPCLVKVFLYHHLEQHICVVTNLCSGGTLHDAVVRACRDLPRTGNGNGICPTYTPPPCSYKWLAEVFLGLEYVHLRIGGINRDLKLKNVGITVPGPTGHAQLLDYGSYRLTGPSLGKHSFGGPYPSCSPGYASPEILRGNRYDYRTDFYSLGVMIWVMFTGGISKDAHPIFNFHFRRCQDLWNDWKTLRQYVQRAKKSGALPIVPDHVNDLLLSLTEYWPQRRGRHDDLRATLGRCLGRELPPYEEQPGGVREWLEAS